MRIAVRIIPYLGIPLILAACANAPKIQSEDQKKEIRKNWDEVRGRVKYRMAMENFNNGQIDEALKRLQESIALNPSAADSYILLAKVFLERGEVAHASKTILTAREHKGDTAEMDYLEGVIAQRYSRFDEALRKYRQASEREPMNAHYVAAVAETLVALGRPEDAILLARSRWTDFEQNVTLRSLVGSTCMMLERYEEAAVAYREADRISSHDEILKRDLGSALVMAGHYDEAYSILSELEKSDDKPPASMLIDLGRCHLALKQADQAKLMFRRATETAPNNLAAWTWLTRAAIASGDWITARQAAKQTTELQPDNGEYAALLAYVCHQQGDYDAAARILDGLIKNRPSDPLATRLRERIRQDMARANDATGGDAGRPH